MKMLLSVRARKDGIRILCQSPASRNAFSRETESFDRGISLIFPGKACHKQGKPLSITKEKALLP
ncbi:hypothetical protein GCWU000341_01703 [Oribacterium sp. oral taxon 078 str. F0262]|nr:hypothetical protein GCWU000341_01703 [Oribacterium sp. oral taxon 078 str. F0262]